MNEHQEQVALIHWFRLAHPKLIMFAIPNAAKRSPGLAAYMKAEGLVAGVSDLFLMKPNKQHHGLFIEMKAAKGKVSEQQEYFVQQAQLQGYAACVCFGFEQAQSTIENYLRDV
jgi:hypothetical protein